MNASCPCLRVSVCLVLFRSFKHYFVPLLSWYTAYVLLCDIYNDAFYKYSRRQVLSSKNGHNISIIIIIHRHHHHNVKRSPFHHEMTLPQIANRDYNMNYDNRN